MSTAIASAASSGFDQFGQFRRGAHTPVVALRLAHRRAAVFIVQPCKEPARFLLHLARRTGRTGRSHPATVLGRPAHQQLQLVLVAVEPQLLQQRLPHSEPKLPD
ncbi:MAG: hypothetical protein HND58_08060 [Planctomycetota bacterium]|nr:MAG: hypothetical protein HND58_08060 [Planctomycetota bacterium]